MILVTGGTGLLGAHLLLELAKQGKEIRALKRPSSKLDYVKLIFDHYTDNSDELLGRINWVEGDVLDIISLAEAMQDVEYIYHVAAVVSFHKKDQHQMMQANVEGTANMVNVALDKSVRKFCYVSSIASLGRAEHNGLIDEHTKWASAKENSQYGISKYRAEREIWRGIEEGLDAVVVNPSVILGLANPDSGSTQIFATMWNGLKFYTTGVNGFVDVRDVVKVMIQLMDSNIRNEGFVVSAENLSYKDLFWKIADIYDKPRPRIRVTKILSGLAWRAFKVFSLFTGKTPLITRETAITALEEFRYSNEKVRKNLNFEFIDIRKTIEDVGKSVQKYYLK